MKIQIDLNEEENYILEIFKAVKGCRTKEEVCRMIIRQRIDSIKEMI